MRVNMWVKCYMIKQTLTFGGERGRCACFFNTKIRCAALAAKIFINDIKLKTI